MSQDQGKYQVLAKTLRQQQESSCRTAFLAPDTDQSVATKTFKTNFNAGIGFRKASLEHLKLCTRRLNIVEISMRAEIHEIFSPCHGNIIRPDH